jgi:general secretion pathway protein H
MRRPSHPPASSVSGFTLLEVLAVLVVIGVMLGVATFNAAPSERQVLLQEARRISLLMQLARDEALVRSLPVAFEADEQAYRFLIRQDGKWNAFPSDEQLRERGFAQAPIRLNILPQSFDSGPLRIVFGREPIDKPFTLTLFVGDTASATIRGDGIGNFTVE